MDREKQIDEMAMLMSEGARPAIEDAIILYEKGYRKQSEVAKEIFEEIDILGTYNPKLYAELKKKYEDGKK